jgi:predicted outer membrane repeat protein
VVINANDIAGANADHVLYLDGNTNEVITETTIIDGFTITAGQADHAWLHNSGGGLYCDGHNTNSECSPILRHLTFSGNYASHGGGIYNSGSSSGNSNPTLINVVLSGNRAGVNGGGMYSDGRFSGNSNSISWFAHF